MLQTFAAIHHWVERHYIVGAVALLGIVLFSISMAIMLGNMMYPLGIFIGIIPWAIASAVLNLGEAEDKRQKEATFQKGLKEILVRLEKPSSEPTSTIPESSTAHEEFLVHIEKMRQSAKDTMEAAAKLQALLDQLNQKDANEPSAV